MSGNNDRTSGNKDKTSGNGHRTSGNKDKRSGNRDRTSGNGDRMIGNEDRTSGNEIIGKFIKDKTYRVGEKFTIEQGGNASTGYSWKIETSPGLSLVDKQNKLNCDMPGCGSKEIWTFMGTKAGSQQIHATYSRSWEKKFVEPNVYDVKIV